jgi:hypothetical protein
MDRTLQDYLKVLSKKILGYAVTFEQLRQFYMIDLINKGYSPEFISKKMGYSRKDIVYMRRKSGGYLSPALRLKCLQRDNFRCVLCKNTDKLEVHHILPVVNGGKTKIDNLQTLCFNCHKGIMKI